MKKLRAHLAVLQRMLFGQSSDKSRPARPTGGGVGRPDQGCGSGRGRRQGRRIRRANDP
jgi:hypothetical protein